MTQNWVAAVLAVPTIALAGAVVKWRPAVPDVVPTWVAVAGVVGAMVVVAPIVFGVMTRRQRQESAELAEASVDDELEPSEKAAAADIDLTEPDPRFGAPRLSAEASDALNRIDECLTERSTPERLDIHVAEQEMRKVPEAKRVEVWGIIAAGRGLDFLEYMAYRKRLVETAMYGKDHRGMGGATGEALQRLKQERAEYEAAEDAFEMASMDNDEIANRRRAQKASEIRRVRGDKSF